MVDRYLRMRSNLELHTNEVRSVEYSSILERFVSASFDNQLCLFDEEAQSPIYVVHNQQDPTDNVVYAGLHPSGSIASCSRMGLCNIYLVS
jgi:WD40 repeat protein